MNDMELPNEQQLPPAAWQWLSLDQLPKLLPSPIEIVPDSDEANR